MVRRMDTMNRRYLTAENGYGASHLLPNPALRLDFVCPQHVISNVVRKMNYKPDIYFNNFDNSCRFALGISGQRPLYVIGLNPSTADKEKSDRTIAKVMGFAEQNGFDGFVMFNLYPQRTPDPEKLDKTLNPFLLLENLKHILEITSSSTSPLSFLAAWGNKVGEKDYQYLKICLMGLISVVRDKDIIWLKIGELTKKGHPRHPSRASYRLGLTSFDIDNYLKFLLNN